jgi:drug/metabolite transporter (DMT)-like permease
MRRHALALLSGALFGLATPASKALVGDLKPFALAGFLYLGAALAMLPVSRGPWLPQGKDRLRLLGSIMLGGVFGPILLLGGLLLAQASSVSVWLNLELAWTALLGYLMFQESSTRWSWAAVALIVVGSSVLAFRDAQAGWIAGSLVTLACLAWALDNHWTAHISTITPARMTFWKGAVGGTINLGIGLLVGFNVTPGQAGLAVLLGVVSYGISIVLYVRAARGIGATRAQSLFAAAPVWGLLGSVAYLGEPWTTHLSVALLCVVLAVLALWKDTRNQPAPADT